MFKSWRKLIMKKFDLYILVVVLVVTAGLFFMFKGRLTDEREVVISLKGQEYARVTMDGKEHIFEIQTELGYNKVIVDEHGVHIEEADCPDHDCVTLGGISKVGQSIICAPHYLVIEIIGNSDSGIDGMAV